MSERLARITERLPFDSQTVRFSRSVQDRTSVPWYIFVLSLALFVGFSIYTTLLYESFWMTGADLGTYVHMFSATLHGEGFLKQGKYVAAHPKGSYWGGHFTLTLLGFLPVFALVPSPITLLVAKSFVLAASIPVAWVTIHDHVEDRRFTGLLTISYALNPFLWSAWIYDFQEHVLLPVLVLAAYHLYYNERYRLFLLLFTLVLFTNELMVLIMGGFLVGLAVAAYRAGRLRRELPTFVLATGLTIVTKIISGFVVSQFSRVSGIRQAAIAAPIRPFVEGTRATTGGLLSISLTHPTILIDLLSNDFSTKLLFFVLFLLPVLFFAIVDETTLGALAPFLGFAWLFTGTQAYYTFDEHYALYLLPFVYIGAARSFDHIWKIIPSRRILTGLFVVVLVMNVAVGTQGIVNENAVPDIDEHTRTLTAAIDTVPRNVSLVTQNTIYPHVATRLDAMFVPNPSLFKLYTREFGIPTPEYVVFDVALDTRQLDWSIPVRTTYIDLIGEKYGLYRYEDGIWILKRGYNGPAKGIPGSERGQDPLQFEMTDFSVSSGRIENGRIVSVSGANGSNIWYGPYTALPPGNYTATFRINSHSTGSNVVVDVTVGEKHRTIARKRVRPSDGYQSVTVDFTLRQPRTDVEFRGFRTGRGKIVLDSVTVARKNTTGNHENTSAKGPFAGRGHQSWAVDQRRMLISLPIDSNRRLCWCSV